MIIRPLSKYKMDPVTSHHEFEDSRRMKMICLAICFLQLVCSKHFLIETEDTNEVSRETKDYWRLKLHGGGYNGLRKEYGKDYNGEVNEQQKSTKKIQNKI